MLKNKTRAEKYQTYYTTNEYQIVKEKLPDIIRDAEIKASEVLEPTIYEKRAIMEVIKDFIRDHQRKVYGGTALNEALKQVNPKDAIYDNYSFSDIEFYSPTPVQDLVDLCNILYRKGYKFVQGKDAQHEETYSIFVNFQLYCDITYSPTRVFYGIKTIEIDGINYADPHFMLIDYLRMVNQPLTAAGQRWEKAFERMYRLLKDYPIEDFDKRLDIPEPPEEIQSYISRIKTEFLSDNKLNESFLISGIEAYNFYIRHAASSKDEEQMARTNRNVVNLNNFIANVPFSELISVNYREDVKNTYNFLRMIVEDKEKISVDEYFPLFQFTGYSTVIKYDDHPIIRIYEGDGYCIPNVKTVKTVENDNGTKTKYEYKYVSFQYVLMILYINKFRAHLDKNKPMYFNYGIAISNLVKARNIYLDQTGKSVLDNTVFKEFRTNCTGNTISFTRMNRLRLLEKRKQGKQTSFVYTPEDFFKKDLETQAKLDPSKARFKNTSGNKIMVPKYLLFKIDNNGNIEDNIHSEEAEISEKEETSGGSSISTDKSFEESPNSSPNSSPNNSLNNSIDMSTNNYDDRSENSLDSLTSD
ncbi:Poxvirus poly(A) polymerase catalytic subunit-like protein [Acanthamoeba polyphaga mimivirus]|nr:poxvirus poly(A) polymerase catalytic subunit-like protein [Acanthamoeba castellanii mamavirus]EJN40780.1 hypothetical protein lvs_R276 [Acanthamoeba polyphaga lentillevirus]UMZ08140.1 Poxvirus poly(A) polymerase catalytic subunit-like protein [Acanthamoeba polyphaga mimivirus]